MHNSLHIPQVCTFLHIFLHVFYMVAHFLTFYIFVVFLTFLLHFLCFLCFPTCMHGYAEWKNYQKKELIMLRMSCDFGSNLLYQELQPIYSQSYQTWEHTSQSRMRIMRLHMTLPLKKVIKSLQNHQFFRTERQIDIVGHREDTLPRSNRISELGLNPAPPLHSVSIIYQDKFYYFSSSVYGLFIFPKDWKKKY